MNPLADSRAPRTVAPAAAGDRLQRRLGLAVGVLAGFVALQMQSLELRWIVLPTVGLAGAIIVLVMPNKERVLSAAMVLSLQANLNLRLLYGHADSAGLAIPWTVIIAAALLGLYLWKGEFRTGRRWVWRGAMGAPILFYIATTAAPILATSERFVGATQILFDLQLYLVYLLVLNSVRTRDDVRRIVILLFIALGMQSAIYYIQSGLGITFMLSGHTAAQGEIPRPGGTISTVPAEFASFIIPILMIAVSTFITRGTLVRRGPLAVAIAMAMGAIALTYTRAAWAGVVLGSAWIMVVGHRHRLLRRRALAHVCCAAVAAVVILTPMIAKRLAGSPLGSSYSERVALMSMAVDIIKQEPVLGVGAGAYGHVFRHYLGANHDGAWMWIVHNKYLLRTAETGLAGGLALIVLFGAAIRLSLRLVRSPDPLVAKLALGTGAGLIAMCWEMYWDTFRGFTYNALLWLLFGLLAVCWQLERQRALEQSDSDAAAGRLARR